MIKIWIILLLTAVLSLKAEEVSITASVDRNPVGINEQFTYTIEISGESQNLPDVDLPAFTNFAVISGPHISSSFQIINFNMSASKTYRVVLIPREAGQFEIPPATVNFKGKEYASNSITVTVSNQPSVNKPDSQPARKPEPGSQETSRDLFLQATVSKRSVYVNEQVNLTYKIYFRVNIQNPEFIKLPETIGFWVEEYPLNKNIPIRQEVVDGVQYNVAEIRKMALYPTKAGKLKISPMEMEVEAVVRRKRQRDPFDIFDDFFSSPFGQVVKRNLVSQPVTINVRQLPANGKPVNFSGLVGDFKLSSHLDKNSVQANNALTLTIKLEGTGNLKVLNDLPLDFPSNFEVYDPKIKEKMVHGSNSISGSKEFEYILIPRVPGEFTIPPLEIAFFNPANRRYEMLSSPEYHLIVTGDGLADNFRNSYLPKEEVRLLGKDINFIKETLDLRPRGYRAYQSTWFVMSILIPTLALIGAIGYRTHTDRMASNVEYARKRKARRMARNRLKKAHHFMKKDEQAEFYGAVSSALLGYLADKTNRSAAGLLKEEVDQILVSRNVDNQLRHDFITCLEEADFRRFAPAQTSKDGAQSFYEKAENILIRLEKYL